MPKHGTCGIFVPNKRSSPEPLEWEPDSKTLEHQRTNPREYQIVRTHKRKPLEYKTQHHPTTSSTLQDASSKQQTKQKYKPNHQQTGLLSLAHQRKTNKQKNSAQISPYMKLTQTTGPTLGGQKPKGRKNSTLFKERIQLSLRPGKRRPQTQ